jgi:SAM-dependent methyltransferase
MLKEWRDVVGCPYCCGVLESPDGDGGVLRCRDCGERFAVEGRIPVLVRREDAGRLAQFAREYQEARLQDGWQRLTAERARALPYGQPPGYPPLYWEVRRQSFCALMSLMAREGPSPAAGPAADVGAGIGWLSYRLAQLGYRMATVEASQDTAFGLGAAEQYYASEVPFLPVQGDLNHLPLQHGKLGLVIFNASLHYAVDLERTLQRSAQALRRGGRLIVLDTPISRHPRPGTGQGDRHLSRRELQAALVKAGLRPRWIEVRRGLRWWSHQLKAWLRRDPTFSFPMIAADRT